MPRPRVLSLSLFGGQPKSPESAPAPGPTSPIFPYLSSNNTGHRRKLTLDTFSPQASTPNLDELTRNSPSPSSALQQRNRSDSRASRPTSMIQTMPQAAMDLSGDTLPELQPIFSFLNSHSNKLYQEGYFLKLHDLDSRGRPSTDRTWTECFAQLVGTVLSLWDAAALDAAGEEGEVLPTFINLSDASIKMIESLPMNSSSGGNLQNVLSISTAASNRYLLHFNSLNSLTQWTAGIRLAMYEHATLQEAYTGSLIAGKGKLLNNIRSIMEKSRFKTEDWTRVRFGAGTPWRRCWCVISPPDEKEIAKMHKELKKRNNYEKKVQAAKGDIKFYDTRRVTKKTQPIATINDAYAAYAIYPQSKPLVDQSTLIKLEGLITIHSQPETTSEGFIFVMPEVHPAVTGFEMMLRWLFPVWDTFAMYGRPNRLIADTLDQRGLMFAMPRDRRYGYIDILDVSGVIHTEGSQAWSERQWRSELKKLTSHRMNAGESDPSSPLRKRRNTTSRTSLPSMNRGGVKFDDDQASQSSPVSRKGSPAPSNYDDGPVQMQSTRRVGAAPVNGTNQAHRRSVSDAMNYKRFQSDPPSRLSIDSTRDEYDQPPRPPIHGVPINGRHGPGTLERVNSEQEPPIKSFDELNLQPERQPLAPVASPPAFIHNPSSKPPAQPYQAPELRRATSGMDAATLHQMKDAVQQEHHHDHGIHHRGDSPPHEVSMDAEVNSSVLPADVSLRKELVDQTLYQKDLLPTIPASPVPQNALLPNGPTIGEGPPPPDHTVPVVPNETAARSHQPVNIAVHRKPLAVPTATTTNSRPVSSQSSTPSSIDGIRDQLIDDDALEQILKNDRTSTMHSSIPDYESVDHASVQSSPKKIEKQRAGRLKTVGDTSVPAVAEEPARSRSRSVSKFDTFYTEQEAERSGAMPAVDFGPTYSHKPSYRPSSRGALTPTMMLEGHSTQAHSPASPGRRTSYFGGRTTPNHSHTNPVTPVDSLGPTDSRRRSMVWQPGGPGADPSPRHSLTPEQWVQHRASIASQPMALRSTPNLGMERPSSSAKRHSSSGITPPTSRHTSGDWTQQAQRTPPQNTSRPGSRNAGFYLQSNGSMNLLEHSQSASLTAREQMHVARATGGPLVNLEKKDPRKKQPHQQDANAGLYAALSAREREKTAIKEGYRSNAVQQAIAVKQQQQAHEMQVRMQHQYQLQQAAQAAQVAQYQAQMQQQAAQARAMGVQQQQQQQMQMQHGQQWQQARPGMQSQRSSQFIDPQRPPAAGWNGQQQQQQRSSMYGGYAASNFTRPSPR